MLIGWREYDTTNYEDCKMQRHKTELEYKIEQK